VTAYPDTSFLVSLYVNDVHSEQAGALMAQAELPFLLTSFQELELVNAIYSYVFRGKIKLREAKASIALFRHDVSSGVYFQKPFSATVFERGMRLAQKLTSRTGIRALDLLHISAALEFKARTFYSFDQRQKNVAAKLGLPVLPA
jgi:predicted nucleic acid-binding protein